MANEFTGRASFLSGLSDLWLRFFQDKDALQAVYRGTEILMGQVYLDLVSSVLNVSMREMPVFNKEFFKLLTVREDNVTYDAVLGSYVFELPDNIKNFTYLYNKIFAQTAILERDLDFVIDISGDAEELQFNDDPFNWGGTGNTPPGFAYRTVEVLQDDGSTTEEREIAFWIPDAEIDQYNMYLTHGYLLNRFEPSSEEYRALLRGITRYFVLGPAFDHTESALNVFSGVPVIRDDGEILQEVDSATDTDYNIVKTSRDDYYIPAALPLKTEITTVANWGTLELAAFQVLTTVFTVKDAISDPVWWHNVIVPEALLPDEPRERRVVSPTLFDNLVNNPDGLVKIGDPGFFIGADDDGFVPTGRPGQRHLFSYVVFERFLRHHIYTIILDGDTFQTGVLPFEHSRTAVEEIVIAGASAYTYLLLEGDLFFEEEILLEEDTLDAIPGIPLENAMQALDNQVMIGDKSWTIGDSFSYTTGHPPSIDIGTGKTTNITVGGIDPSHLTLSLADDESGTNKASVSWNGSTYTFKCSSKGIFVPGDVGRFVTTSADKYYRKILAVTDIYTVEVEDSNGGSGLTWNLWESAAGGPEERIGFIEWPVQVKAI